MKQGLTPWLRQGGLPLLAGTLYLVYYHMDNNQFVDVFYTNGLSKIILRGLSGVSALVTFSIAEVMATAMVITLVILGIRVLLALFRGYNLAQSVFKFINMISILMISFLLIWGFNYRARGLEVSIGLAPLQGTVSELEVLASDLAVEAGLERALMHREDEMFSFSGDLHESCSRAYIEMGKQYPEFIQPMGRAKPLLTSSLFSKLGILGIFFPYTGEANYNADQQMLLLPSAVLHELAHLKGIAREEEANFMAYLVSRYSDEPALRYSSSMLALINTQNRLYRLDPDAFRRVHAIYTPGMKLDLREHRLYWESFEGPIKEKAEQVNDSFLKSNGQNKGVESYEDMVSYLLAYQTGKPKQ